ncbi:6-carboxytetrahydropterin synthase [Streptomyces sp. WAC06614]|uniref:6-pyruvoyl trahydropterin synthase family protein n=1 Tax=Streptomyces sp. WAC06614 TaxID=2487416 RepID=UPI000F7730E6|nr:6-carboxytetrahydropterin synthase [Streptomyces sp. WAC06614]RSS83680.1 6-carboxytetrahydropterin synthase [Streptomyces sp. WAC06614]
MEHFTVTKVLDFAYGHRLVRYSGKCRHLHGHNGLLEVVLDSDRLDDKGMVIDFGQIKETVGTWVRDHLDHRLILCKEDPLIPLLEAAGEPVYVMADNPTAENIAKEVWNKAKAEGLPVCETRLWETPTSLACYRGAR